MFNTVIPSGNRMEIRKNTQKKFTRIQKLNENTFALDSPNSIFLFKANSTTDHYHRKIRQGI